MCEVSPTGFGQCVCAPEEHCKGHKKEVTKFQPHLIQLFLFSVCVILLYSFTVLKIVFFPQQVCGTDGKTYPSHCELHRAACIQGHPIAVDHSQKGCTKKPTSSQKDKKKTRKSKSEKMDKSRVVQSSKY